MAGISVNVLAQAMAALAAVTNAPRDTVPEHIRRQCAQAQCSLDLQLVLLPAAPVQVAQQVSAGGVS